jgi:hypothetical protein
MIGMITPLVKGPAGRRRIVVALAAFSLGALISGTAVGAILGLGGSAILRRGATEVRWAGIPLAVGFAYLAFADFGVAGLKPPSLRRQTSYAWWHRMPAVIVWTAWGADLGAGFSTIRATSLYWFAACMALFVLPPRLAPVITASYAAGVIVSLTIALAVAIGRDAPHGGVRTVFKTRGLARVVSGTFLTVSVLAITVALVRG